MTLYIEAIMNEIPIKAIGGGGKKYFSQINFNLCLNERSTFCGFKKCSTTSQLNLDFSKLGPEHAKIGKYIGICMENGQKFV